MSAKAKPEKLTEKNTVSASSYTDSKKRHLSSPLDRLETKKHITMSKLTTNPESASQVSFEDSSDTNLPSTSTTHVCTLNISLGQIEMVALAGALKSSFQSDIQDMISRVMASTVKSIVDGVLEGLLFWKDCIVRS